MDDKSFIQLSASRVKDLPFQTYDEFIFIVNGKEFKTTRIISDLISPKICQLHLNDPTISQYTIKTKHKGDFSQILKLVNFEKIEFSDDDYDFFIEITENLCNRSIEFSFQDNPTKLTNKNIFKILCKHEKYPHFFAKKIDAEIDYISSHFYELFDSNDQYQKLQSFELETIEQIINNYKLKLKDEDQLLNVVNFLYLNDSKFSILYEYIDFKYISTKMMKEYIRIFDINDINSKIWGQLTNRLNEDVNIKLSENNRYIKKDQKKSSHKNKVINQNKKVVDPFIDHSHVNSIDPFETYQNNVTNRRNVVLDPFADQTTVTHDRSSDSDDPFRVHRSNRNTPTLVDPFATPPTNRNNNFEDPFASINISHNPNDPFH